MSYKQCSISKGCAFIDGHEYDCSDYERDTHVYDYATPEAKEIVEVLLPEIMHKFVANNSKYRNVRAQYDLGLRGMFPDLNRKCAVLRTRIWDGIDTPGESTETVIDDMIGHLLLIREELHSQKLQAEINKSDEAAERELSYN